ncbi:MAG: Rid family detoxifying hydrolase [Oscillospiraceae bacterium]
MKKIIYTKNAPTPVGAYSQAIGSGDTLYASGQIGLSPESGKLGETLEVQAQYIMQNIKNVLEANNMSFENIVKSTIFLTNMDDYKNVDSIYGSFFGENPPARSCITVSALPLGALLEIEIIACR